MRFPSLQHLQAIDDEAAYSVVANEIVDGGRPYVDAVDRKPPLLFWTYAAVFGVAGKYNWIALHVTALFWTPGSMAGLFVIGRQLFNRETGLVAALLYSVFQPWGTWENLAFSGELLMNLPLVWAWAIAFGGGQSRLRPELLAAGALLCTHSGPDDRVFIWGRGAGEFYLQAQRRPATRHFLTFPLTGLVFGGSLPSIDTHDRIVPGAWTALEQDFRAHPPLFIVDIQSDEDAKYPVRDFPILASLLAERYEPVARTAQGVVYRIR